MRQLRHHRSAASGDRQALRVPSGSTPRKEPGPEAGAGRMSPSGTAPENAEHDVTSPRPYSRIHLLSGTKGFARKYPVEQIALEPDAHSALDKVQMASLLARYEHPFSREIGELARRVGGHGGMDFIMDYRLVYCLHRGLPLDQDVYDAAEWSCIGALTAMSLEHNSVPVAVPDFTRGDWNKTDGYRHAMLVQ